jgi:hypothetical protein
MYLQREKSKKTLEKNLFFVGISVIFLSATDEKAGSGSENQWYGSADPEQYQNVTDPQHCYKLSDSLHSE